MVGGSRIGVGGVACVVVGAGGGVGVDVDVLVDGVGEACCGAALLFALFLGEMHGLFSSCGDNSV